MRRAVKLLNKKRDIKILKVSSSYETEPVGYVKQDWFVNACLKAETNLSPRQLLNTLKDIEKKLKRKKRFIKWGPRTIDLDILFYDNLRLKTKDLVIPHPEMHKRAFILIPLMELEPNLIHPTKRKTIPELLANLRAKKNVSPIRGPRQRRDNRHRRLVSNKVKKN
ncbi:2-amino-4-hydroxy-6-hydroxymethyldihydropteridine diphosphokinase [bacterium]|nr:2-amino-4-hydroxy-6-hydroxymethyldihydropteridine diphosphokinase [bacterium]